MLCGGSKAQLGGEPRRRLHPADAVQGHNKMRIFREEIFGPVLAVTTFRTKAEALQIANDTPYGLGAGVWSRDGSRAFRMGRAIQAGRVWTNCYHAYPAHAAFGGYKESGIGRETRKAMLDHYQQTGSKAMDALPRVQTTEAARAPSARCERGTVRSCSTSRTVAARQRADVLHRARTRARPRRPPARPPRRRADGVPVYASGRSATTPRRSGDDAGRRPGDSGSFGLEDGSGQHFVAHFRFVDRR